MFLKVWFLVVILVIELELRMFNDFLLKDLKYLIDFLFVLSVLNCVIFYY